MNVQQIPETLKNTSQSIGNAVSNTITNAAVATTSIKNSVANTMSDFSSKASVGGPTEFLNSNSIIAKFVFLFFVLIIFMFLLNLGTALMSYFFEPPKSPYLFTGMLDGHSNIVITQDPKNTDSVTVYRSNNQSSGVEFTWSLWLTVNDVGINASKGIYQHVFNKGGNGRYNANGIASVNNSPGLYVDPNTNTLRVILDTISDNRAISPQSIIDISNIPLNKWLHVGIRVQNTILDVYINGTISARSILQSLPKQNYDDVYVGCNGGFFGYISDLRYLDHAASIHELNNIIAAGPNTNTSSLSTQSKISTADYLSSMWYSSKM